MKTVTFYLPEEKEAPTPPEGFKIIGYRTIAGDSINLKEVEPYQYAVWVMSINLIRLS